MPSKRLRSYVPNTSGGGGGPAPDVPQFADTFSLNIITTDSVGTPTDLDTYAMAFAQTDTIDAQTEAVTLGLSGTDLSDSSSAPTDTQSFTLRNWLSASAQTTGTVTNPGNANGANDAAVASMTTALGGANPTMTSTCGGTLPSGVTVTAAIYRGWWQAAITLPTSHCIIVAHSTSALFADVTLIDVTASVNHLTGDFTFDLVAAGINTLAKLQSVQILHKSTDAAAGVTPAVFTVDAGCIELAAAF